MNNLDYEKAVRLEREAYANVKRLGWAARGTNTKNIALDGLPVVKLPCREKIAAGIGVLNTPLRHKPQPFARSCGFFDSASSFCGSMGSRKTRWFAQAVASTPTHRSTSPLAWGRGVLYTPLGANMANSSFDARARQSALVSQLAASPRTPINNEKLFCVYALYRGDEIVYIGSSTGLAARIAQHLGSQKQFDSYSFVTVGSIEEMHELEVRCIARFNPQYNCGLNGTSHSGFVGVSRLRLQYGMGSPALKKAAKNHGVETLKVRDSTYYHAAQMQRAIEAIGGVE